MPNPPRRLHPNLKVTRIDENRLPEEIPAILTLKISHGRSVIPVPHPDFCAITFHESIQQYNIACALVKNCELKRQKGQGDIRSLNGIDEHQLMDYWGAMITSIYLSLTALESYFNNLIEALCFPIETFNRKTSQPFTINDKKEFLCMSIENKSYYLPITWNASKNEGAFVLKAEFDSEIKELINLRNIIAHSKPDDIRDPQNFKRSLWTKIFIKRDKVNEIMLPKINPPEILYNYVHKLFESDTNHLPDWIKIYS
jgi:hypothetical protein